MLSTCKWRVLPTCKVYISQARATPCERFDGSISDICSVTEMEVVEVFAEKTDVLDGAIGELGTFGQDKISDLGRMRYDAVDGIVGDECAGSKVEHAKVIQRFG